MKSGFTEDPQVALTGLLSVALLGVLSIFGGLLLVGLMERSLIQALGGALVGSYMSWMVWQAGRVLRNALAQPVVRGDSGA